mmetsp:Transcript_10970/g.27618  ORF Transcript_10970/g.27618 Transcript_10970/m.27618 type:complete len:229 (+) Transcript_10970:767-1453(+)
MGVALFVGDQPLVDFFRRAQHVRHAHHRVVGKYNDAAILRARHQAGAIVRKPRRELTVVVLLPYIGAVELGSVCSVDTKRRVTARYAKELLIRGKRYTRNLAPRRIHILGINHGARLQSPLVFLIRQRINKDATLVRSNQRKPPVRRNIQRRDDIVGPCRGKQPLVGDEKEAHDAVHPARDENILLLRMELSDMHAVRVREAPHFLIRRRVPQPDGAIFGRRQQVVGL